MAQRFQYQFQGGMKPRMLNVEFFASIGTGGQLNYPDQAGLGTPSGLSVQTGPPRFTLPGQATAGLPTGWVGGFSGVIGGYGAGLAAIARVATGLYSVQLSDDFNRLDSVQVTPMLGVSGPTGVCAYVVNHSVGYGNTIQTGALGAGSFGNQLKNQILIQFHAAGPGVDLPGGGGFFVDIRARDTSAGPQ